MRLGIVRGCVVLSAAVPALRGTRLLLVEPVTAGNLAAGNGRGGGKTLVVADHLAPAPGQLIGFVEGREAANPYGPGGAPVDAYCALIVKAADYRPLPAAAPAASEVAS
ncbi:MAG: EutN/CcmL family microcompartment protein [Betaproteobacteria bacterium]